VVPRHCQRLNLMVNKDPSGSPSPEMIFHHCQCDAVAVVLAVPMSWCRRTGYLLNDSSPRPGQADGQVSAGMLRNWLPIDGWCGSLMQCAPAGTALGWSGSRGVCFA